MAEALPGVVVCPRCGDGRYGNPLLEGNDRLCKRCRLAMLPQADETDEPSLTSHPAARTALASWQTNAVNFSPPLLIGGGVLVVFVVWFCVMPLAGGGLKRDMANALSDQGAMRRVEDGLMGLTAGQVVRAVGRPESVVNDRPGFRPIGGAFENQPLIGEVWWYDSRQPDGSPGSVRVHFRDGVVVMVSG